MPIIHRLLNPETEWQYVVDEFARHGVAPPNPQTCSVMAAIDTDTNLIVGWQAIRWQLHIQPVVCPNPHVLIGLVHATEKFIEEQAGPGMYYFVFATGHEAEIARAFGGEEQPDRVFRKIIPPKPAVDIQ